MTLSTYLYVHEPVDARALHEFCNDLLRAANDRPADEVQEIITEDLSAENARCGVAILNNPPGQGLPAWLATSHAGDYGATERTSNDEDSPSYFARVNWDTGYAYRDEYGGCEVLHARFIVDVGRWLAERNITDWSWTNEFTGETHRGFDRLDEFIGNGDAAQAWFRGTVVPAIRNATGIDLES